MNVVLACTVDEEFTFLGVRRLMRDGLRADGAIVAEPTRMQIVKAHKGVARFFVTTTGRSCHGSSPEQGINAIYRMGKLLVAIERYAQQLRGSRADPLLGSPTLNVGRIEGGTSVNTVPDGCRIEIDRRLLPEEAPREAARDLAQFLTAEAGVDFDFGCDDPWMSKTAPSPKGSEELVARLGRARCGAGNP